ncbi:MAG: DUF4230 domain-containing protein, partial [Bacteroidota bacterium]|nr:DUF4230 domain-containing protein [Bacteroidota bacterium]
MTLYITTVCVSVNCNMRMYLILLLVLPAFSWNCSSNKERSKMQRVLGLQKLSDLATAEYVVTKIIKANDNKTWYKPGDRKILLSCKATLVAGIDLSKISEKNININGNSISLTLPHAKLFYIDIKPEDVKTAYQDISMFRSDYSSQERNELASQAEGQIKESADSLGIFITAESNA